MGISVHIRTFPSLPAVAIRSPSEETSQEFMLFPATHMLLFTQDQQTVLRDSIWVASPALLLPAPTTHITTTAQTNTTIYLS